MVCRELSHDVLPSPPRRRLSEQRDGHGSCRVRKAAAPAQRMGGMWVGEGDQGKLMARNSALFLFLEAPIAAEVIFIYLLTWCWSSLPPEGPPC